MSLDLFHPLLRRWFTERFREPTPAQAAGWAAIARGEDTLISAPTGSGKTLAAFLWSINTLVQDAARSSLRDELAVLYVSPLRALGNDIRRNLEDPLEEIRRLAAAHGAPFPNLRVAVRSGDTPAGDRARMLRRPPHVVITTPESLYLLLTAERSRELLRTVRTVIVDEIHAVAPDKRGAHLALSLERLDRLAGRRAQRIGLSATQKPLAEIACLLTGVTPDGRPRPCAIVDIGHRRPWELSVDVPGPPRGPLATHEMWDAVYDRLAALARQHRTTLVFVHTRRLAERVAHHLTARLGTGAVAVHHGSLSREVRYDTERRLKAGQASVVVATASLELGIDIGHVDLVCHLGAPRSLATLLQRVGRSGHGVGGVARGILFPLTRDELLQCAAAVRAVHAGELDAVAIPQCPLDVLAQQIVAAAAAEEIPEDDLFALVRQSYPYRSLDRREFLQVVEMLSEGIAQRWGRASALLHRDRTRGVLRGRRGARMAALTSGGAIPDTADYAVVHDPDGAVLGSVHEDFAVESLAGDVFLLGNTPWRIRRVEAGQVRVVDAHGAPPSVPFWLGEAPPRTRELSSAVADLRSEIAGRLGDRPEAVRWLRDHCGLDEEGAAQLVDYVAATVAALGCVPTQRTVVAERCFDEAGGMQLVLHAPFGARITRAWGYALRKRFCLTFDFELQAAATDDGIVLSLGPQHSFPADAVFRFLSPSTVRDDLLQAVLASPLFTTRWRWNVTRALAVLRHHGGRRVPLPIQRMRAEDLLAAVFPEQVACQDNRVGPITPPDHPLVRETVRNCLEDALDLPGVQEVLAALGRGEIRTVAVDTPSPSPMAQELLHANPYAFLDDAPLEERRARAVVLRHTDPELARGPGVLDRAAIDEVASQAWPDVRTPEDLHDALLTLGLLPEGDAGPWAGWARELLAAGRADLLAWQDEAGRARRAYVARERLPHVRALLAGEGPDGAEEVARRIVQGWLQCTGPVTAEALARRLGLQSSLVEAALHLLEGQGAVLRGQFTPGVGAVEWCDRRILARIHRLTLGRLRREIDPVPPGVFLRFLLRWQHVYPGTQLAGRDGLLEVVGMLQGLEIAAAAWEDYVFPARLRRYDPADLDALCLAGLVVWGRLGPGGPAPPEPGGVRRPGSVSRALPIGFLLREDLPAFLKDGGAAPGGGRLRGAAQDVVRYLEAHGASFLADIARGLRRPPAEVEAVLWELVAAGVVTGDGVSGLRALLGRRRRGRRRRGDAGGRRNLQGRWALLGVPAEPVSREERVAVYARQLLRRYGVVVRELAARERHAPPWRDLLATYRRWEAQGTVRGGRFVAGVAGEQFALPDAVSTLRELRRGPEDPEEVILSSADPLNLTGLLLPGERVPPHGDTALALRNGTLIDVGPYGVLLARRERRRSAGFASVPPAG
jgi:ATP-dependent Lhr-like helicase